MRLSPLPLAMITAAALSLAPSVGTADRPADHGALLPGTNPLGLRGLLRLAAADVQPRGFFAVGTAYELFSSSDFLAVDGGAADHSRLVASYSLAWAPWRFLEAAFAMHVISDDTQGPLSDELQVAVGDPELAIKTAFELGHGLRLGGLLDLRLPSAVGYFELSGSAINVLLAALASWQAPGTLPLTLHVNLGLQIDNTENLFDDPAALSPAQRFAAQLSSFHRFIARAGVEYVTRWVGPFLELSLEPFLGSGAPGLGDSPGRLSLGLRGWLGPQRGLQLLAAADIGLTGVGDGAALDVAAGQYAFAIPRWALSFGVSYRFDPLPAPALRVVREGGAAPLAAAAPQAPAEAPRAAVAGKIVAGDSDEPVWDARIAVDGEPASALAVDPKSGTFRSYPLPLGRVALTVSAPGFEDARVETEVQPEATALLVRLQRRINVGPGTLRGIVSARGGAPLAGASVLLPDLDRTLSVDAQGNFSLELKPGEYSVVVSAPRYRTQRKKIRVYEGSTVILNVELYR